MRLRALALLPLAVLLGAAGCQSLLPRRSQKRTQARRPPPPRVDLAAQRRAYERGVARFGEDRFSEAREAWLEAVRHGPDTELGRKAKENLAKVDSILKSLREIQAQ